MFDPFSCFSLFCSIPGAPVCTSQLTLKVRNLIGFAASRDMRMRSYFIAEVVRCAFSYGCYQMEVFQGMFPFPCVVYVSCTKWVADSDFDTH
jgi:hypothetical protein